MVYQIPYLNTPLAYDDDNHNITMQYIIIFTAPKSFEIKLRDSSVQPVSICLSC